MTVQHSAARTRNCPYCRGVVPEDVHLHGGNCPHCMLEIPGEEAPTDPGLQMQARLQEEERRKALGLRRRNIALGAFGLMCMGGVGVGVMAWLQARADAITYELPDEYYQPAPLVHAEPPATAAPAIAGPKATAPAKKETAQATEPSSKPPEPETPAVASVTPTPRSRSSEDAPPPEVSAPSSGIGIPTLDVKVDGGFGKLLTDDQEILAMVKSVESRYKPQLQACFESASRAAPDLSGSWTVDFTVAPGGATKSVSVTPLGRSDEAFETCAQRAVSSWKFVKIDHDFKVRKKYTFAPAW